jgi:hypothetical protein
MSDLYGLTNEQMSRLEPYFSGAMASPESIIGGY